jgi:hypothetical protein
LARDRSACVGAHPDVEVHRKDDLFSGPVELLPGYREKAVLPAAKPLDGDLVTGLNVVPLEKFSLGRPLAEDLVRASDVGAHWGVGSGEPHCKGLARAVCCVPLSDCVLREEARPQELSQVDVVPVDVGLFDGDYDSV